MVNQSISVNKRNRNRWFKIIPKISWKKLRKYHKHKKRLCLTLFLFLMPFVAADTYTLSDVCPRISSFVLGHFANYSLNYSQDLKSLQESILNDSKLNLTKNELKSYVDNPIICNITLPRKEIETKTNTTTQEGALTYNLSSIEIEVDEGWNFYIPFTNKKVEFINYIPLPSINLGYNLFLANILKYFFKLDYSDYYTDSPNIVIKGPKIYFIIVLALLCIIIYLIKTFPAPLILKTNKKEIEIK